MGKPGNRGCAIERFEFIEFGIIDQPGNDFAYVILLFQIDRHDAVKFGGIVLRLAWLAQPHIDRVSCIERADNPSAQRKRMAIVLGVIVGNAGFPRMHVGAAEFFRSHDLAGGGFDQRRPAEKNRALIANDDGLV